MIGPLTIRPPPASSADGGNCVKTAMLSLRPPRQNSIQTTENRGPRASSVMTVTSPLSKTLINVLGRRSDFSRSKKSTSATKCVASTAPALVTPGQRISIGVRLLAR